MPKNFLSHILKLIFAFVLAMILAVVSLTTYALVYPTRMANFLGENAGVSVEKIILHGKGGVEIKNLQFQDIGKIGFLAAQWQWNQILSRKLDSLNIRDIELNVSRALQKFPANSTTSSPSSNSPLSKGSFPPLSIGRLTIENVRIVLPNEQNLTITRAELMEIPQNPVSLTIDNLQAGEWGQIESLNFQWNWHELQNRQIDTVKIFNASVNLEKILQSIPKNPAPAPQQQTAPASANFLPPIIVKHLILEKTEILLAPDRKTTIEKAEFQGSLDDLSKLIIHNLRVEDFARVETVKVEWTWQGLQKREIEYLDVTGVNISLDRMEAAYPPKKKSEMANNGPDTGFHLKELRIRQSQLTKNIFGKRLPNFVLPIAQASPDLVFHDLYLGGPTDDPAANQPVEAVIPNYTLTSPYDGISPMLSFGEIRVVFTWAGIQNQRIEKLQISNPIIYIGNDLFWFADDIKKAAAEQATQAPKPDNAPEKPWVVGTFSVMDGRIALSAYGQKNVLLPFHFTIEPQFNIVVSDLTQLHLKTQCEIPPTTIEYPDYGDLKFVNLSGKMEFSLPPKATHANNIVNTLAIDTLQWKSIEAHAGQMWVTYDAKGIYAGFYAQAYGGAIGGDLTFYWDNTFSWIGSCYTNNIDIEPITKLLSPENFLMTGPIESRFVVRGEAKDIHGLGGIVNLNQNGKMKIIAVDDLLIRIPKDWSPMKRDLASTALRSFRDYDYQNGFCEFAYTPPQSYLKLHLNGLQGQRNFDVKWNDKIEDLLQ